MAKEALGTSTRGNTENANTNDSPRFDLHSWQGLTEVLKVARESELADAAYAEFRDLVLQYAQSKGDAELKAKIDAYIREFKTPQADVATSAQKKHVADTHEVQTPKANATPSPEPENTAEAETTTTTEQTSTVQVGSRPTPTFSVRNTEASTPKKKASSTTSAPPRSEQLKQVAHTQFVPENLPTEDLASEGNTPQTDPPAEAPSEPIAAREQTHKQEAQPSSAESAEATPDTPATREPSHSTEASSEREQIEAHKARIAEIKQAVNRRVGNPVTLIDSGNPLGRTYMTALLAAMKATAGGRAGALSERMAALEDAYTEVMQYLDEHGDSFSDAPKQAPKKMEKDAEVGAATQSTSKTDVPAPPSADDSKLTETPPDVSEDQESASGSSKISSEPPSPERSAVSPKATNSTGTTSESMPRAQDTSVRTSSSAEQTDTPRDEMDAIKAELETTIDAVASEPPVHTKTPQQPKSQKVEDGSAPQRVEKPAEQHTSVEAEDVPKQPMTGPDEPETNIADDATAEADTPSQKSKKNLASHIDEGTQSKWDTAPDVRPQETEEIKSVSDMVDRVTAAQSELNSDEVTEGLHQLLEQWDLFKRSGLLGMGPGGNEHPLYKQLSVLPMSEVVAGRWEGASRENIKILKDYINAWRNEQGITYSQSETFEHYLRRVVQRVLKRQNVSI